MPPSNQLALKSTKNLRVPQALKNIHYKNRRQYCVDLVHKVPFRNVPHLVYLVQFRPVLKSAFKSLSESGVPKSFKKASPLKFLTNKAFFTKRTKNMDKQLTKCQIWSGNPCPAILLGSLRLEERRGSVFKWTRKQLKSIFWECAKKPRALPKGEEEGEKKPQTACQLQNSVFFGPFFTRTYLESESCHTWFEVDSAHSEVWANRPHH